MYVFNFHHWRRIRFLFLLSGHTPIEPSAKRTLDEEGVFFVGQEQDTLGGTLSVDQAFSGRIADLNVWNGSLPEEDIRAMAECRKTGDGDVVSWSGDRWTISNVSMEETPLASLCAGSGRGPDRHIGMMVIVQETSYDLFKPVCDVVAGRLPTPQTNREVDALHQRVLEAVGGDLPTGVCHDPQRPFSMVVGQVHIVHIRNRKPIKKN